ncbi:histidine phosphatase family protein [Kribbella pittospori]|uniref:Histidine phosphatase family protein n=1 Tax=Kribbella pittospori TaxID=722689 RepID=A0A4V2MAD2_9ACTN|nr:histidine phosphatase family protein [Kribbella pittospori]TCC58822.1 histidine phosphatase family protein [Kribbella pittospori]
MARRHHPSAGPGVLVLFDAVYLARHGQTEWNVEGRRQGRLDSPLTPHGLLQAQRNAALVRREQIDAVFTSPLGRARRTAEILAEAVELQVLDDLAEVAHGEWSGLTSAEIDSGWPGQRTAREKDKYSFRFPGGESYADAELRAVRALESIAATGSRRPLLVSHEMIGRLLVKQLAGLGIEEALRRDQPSDVVYRITSDGSIDRLSSAE